MTDERIKEFRLRDEFESGELCAVRDSRCKMDYMLEECLDEIEKLRKEKAETFKILRDEILKLREVIRKCAEKFRECAKREKEPSPHAGYSDAYGDAFDAFTKMVEMCEEALK